ncbi:MAG: hypothetical protein HY286_10830 [Planctomycetes bacterium]|nr:hypothetical protein [Planctomycetota bacterium]
MRTAEAWPLHFNAPDPASLDVFALALAAVSGILLFRFKAGIPVTLAVSPLLGVLVRLFAR